MSTDTVHREFIPGTTGWTADDLEDPEIERLWNAGRYEIVEGVLTIMPPAYYDGGFALKRLCRILEDYTVTHGLGDGVVTEVDLVLNRRRLPIVDAIFLTPDELKRQREAHAKTGRRKALKYGRILIPPTLIIESISLGHEAHDRETKRRWYAEAGVPNYWLLDAQQRSLECLVLTGSEYRTDQVGRNADVLHPSSFPALEIPLTRLWVE
jgi:Uma2 family endonuclease